ncbi:MAG TPA: DsbE family thiol:disulfide interchange protein [Thauera aminoaromatica]|jgi:cytochrome c biogenesis protein CcmG/thiol:disulfide interchange protein DsbE|uniref:Periplasmic protein thiol/disulfide oxidoreductase DsbE n=2 Tax=Thauera aminoaromatica TaxID=164330 RepID=N6YQ08_THASP|nr:MULTISPECIES: DsbE family thiol:disulfide interchange protein [Thauera]OPZ05462.1 MAG: Thiol:disulfide interchange protein DsbE [Alphaproteobacteria bacterium ADurb.BinA305]ENO84313.1 periplasmic protein thiol/disulfide oxidoreductase DsbE [Thauera aminoaromatica S2]KIN89245.1 periplasmic thiol:disulfide oxidoreductase, DsbE subfamily protein [Thauera sp. SWB20]MBP6132648.1 DsbE family thiol:disulfide interchange protein [Thauera sp.]MCK6399498.1 DsbE family thiol:disulfide interchange prot
MKAKFLVPLLLFFGLAGFLAFGLTLNPREVPSPLIDKPAPNFRLARLDQPEQTFALEEMRGQVWLLNVWASWCVACRQEHPVLVRMAAQKLVPVVGLNYKEVRGDGAISTRGMALEAETTMAIERARRWLADHGNPYLLSVLDIDGRVGIDFGVYGVPETFLIDREGRIRYKHIGPITPESLQTQIMPKVEELRRAG